jgi:hypothetical protein
LEHDTDLVPELRRHAPSRQLLQGDQPIGAGERAQGRDRIAIDVLVDVGAGQRYDQRPARIERAKIADAVGAAPGMQRNHQIRGRSIVSIGDTNAVTELPQDPRPPRRRGAVPRP